MDIENFLVFSENLIGLEFQMLLEECKKPILRVVKTAEDFGLYEMEFRKGEW